MASLWESKSKEVSSGSRDIPSCFLQKSFVLESRKRERERERETEREGRQRRFHSRMGWMDLDGLSFPGTILHLAMATSRSLLPSPARLQAARLHGAGLQDRPASQEKGTCGCAASPLRLCWHQQQISVRGEGERARRARIG